MNDISASDFSKYDDPMTVSTNIINECKKLQIPCDFPPLKLKGGFGEQVLIILTQLATKALKRKNFSFKKPKYEDPKGE
jgi:estrogen-related receptor beta like 1